MEEMLDSGNSVDHQLFNLKARVQAFMQLMQDILEMTSERLYRDEVCTIFLI